MSLLPLVKQIAKSLNIFIQQLKSGNLFQPSSLKKWGWKARAAFALVAFLTIIGVSAFAIQQITSANNPESSIQKSDTAPKSSVSNRAMPFFVPVGSEFPTSWSVTSFTTGSASATGTTPSGIVVTVTTTGNIGIQNTGNLMMVHGGTAPSYFPSTTTQAIDFIIPNNSVCSGNSFTGCGTITYTFSKPVQLPVLYIADAGKGAGSGNWSAFVSSPWTISTGTFSLDVANSQTVSPATPMSIQNSSKSVGVTNPGGLVGTTIPASGSCSQFGCGAYDVNGVGSISSIVFNLGYQGTAGTGSGNDFFTAVLGTTPTPDLAITKSSNGPWTVGQSGANYTLNVANNGLFTTSGIVTVRDALPTGITANWSGTLNTGGFACTFSGQNVTCTTSTAIAVSGTATLTLPVNVTTAATVGTNTNYASIGGGGDAFNSGTAPTAGATCTDATHCASNATTVTSPNLTISKTHTPTTFIRNSTGTYTLTVGNTGTIATSGTITVTDTLPTGLTIPAGAVTEGGANAADWTCTASGQTITCTSSTAIAASGSSVFSFNVNVASNATASVTNNVTVSGGNEATANNTNNSATDATPTALATDLSITKTNGQTSYYQGQYMVYSIVVTNNGPNAANNAIFTDPSNSDFTVVSVTCGSASGSAACPTAANTTIALMQGAGIVIPTLPSGGSVTFTVAGALKSNVTGSFSNTANIAVPSGVTETNSSNNSATDTDFSSGSSTFTACSSGADYVEWAGTYASGTGAVDSTASLTPHLPNLTYTTTGSGGSLALNTAEVVTAASGTDSGWTNLFGSPNGAEITRYHVTTPGSITPIVQTITFASAATPNTWGFMIADQDVEQIKIEAYDASGVKYSDAVVSSWYRGVYDADAADSINLPRWLGPTLPYTMGSGANGALPAIPPATIFASQPASVTDTSRASIWFTPTSAIKTLVITYQNLDSATSTDRLYIASCLKPAVDLTLAKSHSGNFTVGSTGTYNFTVSNSGTGASSGTITMTDTLPTGLTVNNGAAGTVTPSGTNAANWACSSNATNPQTVTCTSSTAIAGGGSSSFGITVNVGTNTAVGTNSITNTASISGGGDGNAANNSSSDPTTVLAPDLTIAKSHSGDFTRGSTGTYTLTVNNIGAGSTSGTITVVDTLPTGLSVANGTLTLGGTNSANWSCSAASNVITCTSSTAIATSGSSVFTFNVNVASDAATSVTNSVAVSGGGEPTANNGNNTATDPTTIPQSNFGSCDARIFLTQQSGASNSLLYDVNYSSNPFTFPSLGTGSTIYNAIAYNPADNYIYALENNNSPFNNLIRLGADGSTVNLGAITGLPTSSALATGEIGTDGVFYVKSNSAVSTFYAIDITTRTATSRTASSAFNSADWAWSNGLLYSVDTLGVVRSINPNTGAVTAIGNSGVTSGVGAMWGTPNGVYGNQNGGAGFYKFDTTNGSATKISNSPGATNNDGAHCVNADITFPADIAVTKTDGQTNYTAGSNVVYTITATNNGPFGAQNVTVADALPSGITTASWTCAATGGGTCAASGTGAINDSTVDLPIGAVATYTLTMAVPAGFTGNLVNTATVTVSSSNTDLTPGNNTASDTDTGGVPNVGLVKSCPTPANCTTASQNPGTDLTYNIVFTNTGGQAAANMVLVDGIPTNTDYKLGSATSSLGTTGLTIVIEYSSDYDALNPTLATWTYTPVSGGGGADAGYDRLVKAIRWRVASGTLSNVSPNNTGNVSFITKIR